jgi:hypothetical protein
MGRPFIESLISAAMQHPQRASGLVVNSMSVRPTEDAFGAIVAVFIIGFSIVPAGHAGVRVAAQRTRATRVGQKA